MYILPNKSLVDVEGAIDAILDTKQLMQHFLDISTGQIKSVSLSSVTKTNTLSAMHAQSKRYFEVPHPTQIDKDKWLREFITEIISFEDVVFSKKILALPNENFYERAIEEITNAEDWIDSSDEWLRDCAFEQLDEWLRKLPVKIIKEWEGVVVIAPCVKPWQVAKIHYLKF